MQLWLHTLEFYILSITVEVRFYAVLLNNMLIMDVDNEELENVVEQEARAFLRERFLKAITHLAGKECKVHMYENTDVKCKLRTFDPEINNVVVEDLDTPINKRLPKAILRTSDIISMHVTLTE